MAIETTFSIIKPNAVKKNAIGAIIQLFEKNGLEDRRRETQQN